MCSELTPRAHIPDTRIPQLMQPCFQQLSLFWDYTLPLPLQSFHNLTGPDDVCGLPLSKIVWFHPSSFHRSVPRNKARRPERRPPTSVPHLFARLAPAQLPDHEGDGFWGNFRFTQIAARTRAKELGAKILVQDFGTFLKGLPSWINSLFALRRAILHMNFAHGALVFAL